MAIDQNSNGYTYFFAVAMVLVVAASLSFIATTLKPMQDNNVEQEKMQNILSSIKIDVTREEAAQIYGDYITESFVVSASERVDDVDAFSVDMLKEVRRPNMERNSPLYIAQKEGKTYYIIPLQGTGLWGPIWGYIALEEDMNTVYGAVFDHKAETPGLGAEINTAVFMDQFPGKRILDDNGQLLGIDVRKGGSTTAYEVDGISGGTITSDGVELMIVDCLEAYIPFLKEYLSNNTTSGAEL